MSRNRIVVIGGVAAGPKAAARARRMDPEAEITILERGQITSYAGCGLPYYIAGLVKEAHELWCTPVGVPRDASFFKGVKDIVVRTGTLAESIDRATKEVAVADVKTGARSRLPYDKLVLAIGGSPIVPRLDGVNLAGVLRLANPDDAIALRRAITEGGARRVTIVGGGLIGAEVTESLASLGVEVTVVEMMDRVLSALLDADMVWLVARHMESKGVEIRLGEKVTALEGNGAVRRVVTNKGAIDTDLVLLAIGVRPNVGLAREAGLAIGETGAIAVNQYLQTSDPDIYAGGDCVENTHLVSGRKVYVPLGSTANKHGRIIGDNVAGGSETFTGILGTAVLKVFDYNVGRTGLTEREARALGYDVVTSITPSPDCAHYYPNNKTVVLKLIADAKTRRVLGAQALGPGEAVKRIDVLATAITFGATLEQVASLDLGYAPPYSTAIDLAAHGANVVRNKLAGVARGISAAEVQAKIAGGEEFVLLDVRTPKEFAEGHVDDPRVKFIPLGKLRERSSELPRDRQIVTVCKVGLRGYEASTILKGAGFTDVAFLDGGLMEWPDPLAK